MMVLVDTPVWSIALRRRSGDLDHHQRDLRKALEELISEGRVILLGVIRQELLSGIRDEAHFRRLRDSLRAFENIDLAAEDYEEAAGLSNRCRAAGVGGSSIDFLICAVASRRDWSIFTLDQDFARYRRHAAFKLFQAR